MAKAVLVLRKAAFALPVLFAAGAAPAQNVPQQLQPPGSPSVVLRANAQGSQIYVCGAKAGGGGYEWTLKAPDAVLADTAGRQVARHYGGPTWEAPDGSKVMGEAAARVDAPGGQAIPWLLLKAKSHDGNGQFTGVSYIQRIETRGGVAPTSGCDAAHIGEEDRVPYTAVYVFYR